MIITLIGMPGCGKSCMGRSLASKLKMKLIDSDRLIEKIHGKKLQELINEFGVDGFSKIEEEALLSIEDDNIILSTGGSAVYYDDAMQHLKSKGKVIYLYCSLDTITKRIGDFSNRGVVLREGQTLEDLYNERTLLYRKYADITIFCDGNAFPQYQSDALRAASRLLNKPTRKSNYNNRADKS